MFLMVGGDGTLGTALQSCPTRPEGVVTTSRREQLLSYRVDLADAPERGRWKCHRPGGRAASCQAIVGAVGYVKRPKPDGGGKVGDLWEPAEAGSGGVSGKHCLPN